MKKNKVIPYFAKSKTIQHEGNQEEEKRKTTISVPGKEEHSKNKSEEEKRKTFSKSTIYQDYVKKMNQEEEKDEEIPDLKEFNQADLGFDKKQNQKKDKPKARTTNLRETQKKPKNNPKIKVTDLFVDVDDEDDGEEKKTVVKG